MLSHDSRMRCDLVDLYYTLYGNRRPICIPLPELAGLVNLGRLKGPIPRLAHSDGAEPKKEPAPAAEGASGSAVDEPGPAKQELFSDNSVSLPGLGQGGPVGFEPGMFKKEGGEAAGVKVCAKVTEGDRS